MSAVELESPTYRRRERNAAQSVEILPPDVETKIVALRPLAEPMQAAHVTAMLENSHKELLAAVAAHDLPRLVVWRQKAGAIQEIAKQVKLGKNIQLDAAEFLRRAERALATAVREGQARGEIATEHEAARQAALAAVARREVNQGRRSEISEISDLLPTAADFLTSSERNGSGKAGLNGSVYAMADGVDDEQFEEALAEALAEGNLSRANVGRKCRAKVNPPPGDDVVTPIPIRRKTGAQRQKARTEARNAWISSAIALQSISTQLSRIPISDLEVPEHDDELRQAFRVIADAIKTIGKLEREIRNEHL